MTSVLGAVAVHPGHEVVEVLIGLAGGQGGMTTASMPAGAVIEALEEVGVIGWLEGFEHSDGADDGLAYVPGRAHPARIVLALVRPAGHPPAVRPAGAVCLDAQAAAGEGLDYWREGVIPTVHYSLD
ncbi:hypothetical protein [Streptomyces mirabilis]|uniref:hypothetical protein n=1 Tax=Streptomyces mirabilis TaxID=68239 RepID=UPI0033A916F4